MHHRAMCSGARLTRLEEEHRDLPEVKVDEVLGFVSDVGAEVAADDAVPGGVVLLIELLLDEGSDVLLDVVLLKSLAEHSKRRGKEESTGQTRGGVGIWEKSRRRGWNLRVRVTYKGFFVIL